MLNNVLKCNGDIFLIYRKYSCFRDIPNLFTKKIVPQKHQRILCILTNSFSESLFLLFLIHFINNWMLALDLNAFFLKRGSCWGISAKQERIVITWLMDSSREQCCPVVAIEMPAARLAGAMYVEWPGLRRWHWEKRHERRRAANRAAGAAVVRDLGRCRWARKTGIRSGTFQNRIRNIYQVM